MHHRSGKPLFAAIILLIVCAGMLPAQTKTIEEIVAWVNGDVILKSEYEARKAALRQQLSEAAPRGAGLQGAQLEQAFNQQSKLLMQAMIDETLILQQARDLGLSANTEIIKTMDRLRQEQKLDSLEALEKEIVKAGYNLEDFKQNIGTQYLTDQVMQREVYPRVIITTEEVRKYYDSHISEFDRPAGLRLREITLITEDRGPELVESQRKNAEEALAALKKGEDFAQVASKFSESNTAADGGELPFIKQGELSPSLEEIIGKLEKGQFTDIIPVEGAFMIFKLEDKHGGGVLPFELAQKEVFNVLWQKAVPPKQREYLTKLREQGYVRTAEGYEDAGAATEKPDKTVAKD
jgi:parvulin-like peptidyl-prolyl isomerase